MKPKVSIIMGSTSDMGVMQQAAKILDDMNISFEINALSAHRTPEQVSDFAKKAYDRGIRVIIAGAGGAAHLPGVVASMTPIPVIGVPIKASISLDGWDSILSILQMPPGIPVATMGIGKAGAKNAAVLAVRILALSDEKLADKLKKFRESMAKEVEEKARAIENQRAS